VPAELQHLQSNKRRWKRFPICFSLNLLETFVVQGHTAMKAQFLLNMLFGPYTIHNLHPPLCPNFLKMQKMD